MAVKVGFIGGGGVAVGHLKALAQIEGVQAVAMADLSAELLKARCAEYNLTPCADHRELLGLVDAVFLVTPPTFRREPIVAAAEAGVHVYCEKPMALTTEDADAMIGAAERAGIVLQIGLNPRYDPRTRKMVELAQAGDLGDLVYCWDHQVIFRPDASWAAKSEARDAWRLSRQSSGGRIFEFCSHKLDWMVAVGGEPESIYGRAASVSPTLRKSDMDDTDLALITFKNGGYAQLELCMSPHGIPRHKSGIMGARASVETDGSDTLLLRRADSETVSEIVLDPPRQDKQRHFFDCIRTGARPKTDGHTGRTNLALCLGFNRSAQTGEVVKL